jgi:hypothetical protein
MKIFVAIDVPLAFEFVGVVAVVRGADIVERLCRFWRLV